MANETGMLAGCIAIITGAASGIGAGIMQKFLDEGARVLGVDLPSDHWSNDDRPKDGLVRFAIDVTLDEAPQEIVKAAIHAFGSIDILVNNAGISPRCGFSPDPRSRAASEEK